MYLVEAHFGKILWILIDSFISYVTFLRNHAQTRATTRNQAKPHPATRDHAQPRQTTRNHISQIAQPRLSAILFPNLVNSVS